MTHVGKRGARGSDLIPRGGALPDDIWWSRHRAIVRIAWLQVPLLLVVGLSTDVPVTHLLAEVGMVSITCLIATIADKRLLGSVTATFALVTTSALLVHFSHGLIEMHFHFFVVVAIITLYQDWRPFLIGLAYVVVHHSFFGTLLPGDVYNHPAALNNPRLWALVHGLFILGASVAGIANWRFNEKITGRLQASVDRLGRSEARFRSLIQHSFDVVAVLDERLDFRYVSPASVTATLHEADSLTGRPLLELIHEDDRAAAEEALKDLLAAPGRTAMLEVRFLDGEGAWTWLEIRATNQLADEDIEGIVLNYHNVTRRRAVQEQMEAAQEVQAGLELQLRQAQKMHSIGQLAGGIAHDFNNILGIVLNYAVFLKEMVKEDDAREDLDEIVKAAQRGAALVRQLLLFSRKEVTQPENLDVDSVIRGAAKLIKRSVGEDVELTLDLNGSLPPVFIDPSQFDQILLNLSVNARDAMTAGGRFTISTTRETLDDQIAQVHPEMAPGTYVCLSFTDSGHGMAREVQQQIFEPFFTTKQRGEGTGLGLATVYGIVKGARGFVYVYSEEGAGTTFRVYLPPSEKATESRSEEVGPPLADLSGTETILVVEDDPAVREMARRILLAAGYDAIVTPGPIEAIEAGRTLPKLDLVLTDVVMPVMTGRAVADAICKLRGPLPLVFMSGYTADVITHRGELEEGFTLLQKPFSARELLEAVRRGLDAPAAPLPPSTTRMSILVVDDEPVFGEFLKVVLEDLKQVGPVQTASTGEQALRLFDEHQPHVVLVDSLRAPMESAQLAAILRSRQRPPTVIAVTASATDEAKPWADAVVYKGARMIDDLVRVLDDRVRSSGNDFTQTS